MEQGKLIYTYDEMILVFREIEAIRGSLHQMGSYYGDNRNEQEYEKETTRFIDECGITDRLAYIRAILASKFDDSIGSDDMSFLERVCADIKYWKKPGDMLVVSRYDATDLEYTMCKEIIKRLIENKDTITEDTIGLMAKKVLSTSYSIGGSYEEDVITKIVEVYIEKGLF